MGKDELRVYLLRQHLDFEFMNATSQEDWNRLFELEGPYEDVWETLLLEPVSESAGERYRKSDLFLLGGRAIGARGRAIDLMTRLVGDEAQLLSAFDGREQITIFNPLRIIDALDEQQSQIERIESTGRITDIRRHVFRVDILANTNVTLFKLPRLARLFVTQKFLSAAVGAGLTGLEFQFLWSETEPMGRQLPGPFDWLHKPKPRMVRSPQGPLLPLSRAEADADPTLLFRRVKEAFREPKLRLKGRQEALRLAIWYLDDVYNGGHYQYLHNKSPEEVEATIEGLRLLGATRHAEILEWAYSLFRATEAGPPPADMEEFMAGAREGTFESIDNEFLGEPTLGAFLHDYVTAHPEEFVSWE